MIALVCLIASGSLALANVPPGDGDAAASFADELPGYYEFYKRTGAKVRLDDEITRDRSLEAGGEWLPVEVEAPAPELKLIGSDGKPVPLRVGGPGRATVVTTFQAWW